MLALLYKQCWPGLVQLTSAQFDDCLLNTTKSNSAGLLASVNVILSQYLESMHS